MTAAYAFKVIVCREWQLSRSEAKKSASAAVHTKMMCTSSYHKIPKGEVRGADKMRNKKWNRGENWEHLVKDKEAW